MTSPYLTTEEAAIRMRYASKSKLLDLVSRGEIVPDGRRGEQGAYLWLPETIDEYLKNCVTRKADRSCAGSDAADIGDSRGQHEKDKRTRYLSTQRREAKDQNDRALPEHRQDEIRSKNDGIGVDDGGGNRSTESTKTRGMVLGPRAAKYYADRLRRAMDSAEIEKA